MTVRGKIRAFIEETFTLPGPKGRLTEGESLMGSGRVDSMGVLSLASFVQDTFGIDVRDDELVPDNFDSIDKLVQYLTRKGVGRAA